MGEVAMPQDGPRSVPTPTRVLEVKDGMDSLLLRVATRRAGKGAKVSVRVPGGTPEVPDWFSAIDRIEVSGSGSIVIVTRPME